MNISAVFLSGRGWHHAVYNFSFCLCWRVKDYFRYHTDLVLASADVEMTPVSRAPSSKEQRRVRVEFPETWLWSETSTGYHLTPNVIYAAEFDSLSWCLVIPGPLLTVFNEKLILCSFFVNILDSALSVWQFWAKYLHGVLNGISCQHAVYNVSVCADVCQRPMAQ